MVFTTEELFEVAIESWPERDLNPRSSIPFRRSNRLSYRAMGSTSTQSQLCKYSNFIVCSMFDFISAIAFVSRRVYFN